MKRNSTIALAVACVACSCHSPRAARPIPDLSRFVDPLIGTRGPGNAVPGPCLPHGMVKLSPDTVVESLSVDAYAYESDRIEGFSHTHLEGPGGGGNGYSQVLLMPTTGPLAIDPSSYPSRFSHATEDAAPGYYAVTLDDYGVRAELTATHRTGFHRYTFPPGKQGHVLIDLGHSRGVSLGGRVEVAGNDTVRGHGVYQVNPLVSDMVSLTTPGTTGVATVYFVARFSPRFESAGTWEGATPSPGKLAADGPGIGAWVDHPASTGESVVEVRVGISYISVEQAEANLERESSARTFEQVRDEAVSTWNRLLSRIEVEGGTDAGRTMFYTALYHALLQPAEYTEEGRFWSGADGAGRIVEADGWRYYTDDWCAWDTFRTTHPLLTLIEPEVVPDMVRSLVHTYETGGWMSKCTWNATGDSRVMTANTQFCVVADAWVKGLDGFDPKLAYEAMKKGSMEDSHNVMEEGLCGYLNQGTPPDYVNLGWVPVECDSDQGASMTLEYAYCDWCTATMAVAAGQAEDAAFFLERSGNWRNVWNPAHQHAQPRRRDGTWVEPFDPLSPKGFTESNSAQYSWFAPHDVCGLVEAMGGTEAFVARLDGFFDKGQFTAGNEPDFHVPFLYHFAGAPARSQERVDAIMKTAFSAGPEGLPGNDDAGATSAWYVLSAIGLYPVAPGDTTYRLTGPAFDRVVLHIEPDRSPGRDFVIEAPGAGAGWRFIRGATLDGKPLDVPRLSHSDIADGGGLVLEMGEEPGEWGTEPECR